MDGGGAGGLVKEGEGRREGVALGLVDVGGLVDGDVLGEVVGEVDGDSVALADGLAL